MFLLKSIELYLLILCLLYLYIFFFNLTTFLDSLPLQFAYSCLSFVCLNIYIYVYACCKSLIVTYACGDGVVPACISGCINDQWSSACQPIYKFVTVKSNTYWRKKRLKARWQQPYMDLCHELSVPKSVPKTIQQFRAHTLLMAFTSKWSLSSSNARRRKQRRHSVLVGRHPFYSKRLDKSSNYSNRRYWSTVCFKKTLSL